MERWEKQHFKVWLLENETHRVLETEEWWWRCPPPPEQGLSAVAEAFCRDHFKDRDPPSSWVTLKIVHIDSLESGIFVVSLERIWICQNQLDAPEPDMDCRDYPV